MGFKARQINTNGMNEGVFWKTIGKFDWSQAGDDDRVMEPACRFLESLGVEAITTFANILAEKLHALDTRKHCKAYYKGELDPDNGDDYISADEFLYGRCVVVANGKALYERVVAKASKFPQGLEFESILYLAAKAFEEKTNETFDHMTPISFESFQNRQGWEASKATTPGSFTGDNVPPGNRRPT